VYVYIYTRIYIYTYIYISASPTELISAKYDIGGFYEDLSRNIKFV